MEVSGWIAQHSTPYTQRFLEAKYWSKAATILGALGCGAFHNPPEEIVKIFNIYLEKYNGCFKTIVFAVLSRSDNNFDIFNANIKRFNIKDYGTS